MEAFKPLLITKLNDLKNELNSSTINLKSIQKQIKDINSFNETQNYSYLNSLLYPEKSKGCKIPSQIPVPSTTFQLKSSFQIKQQWGFEAGKRFGVLINPFFLANNSVRETVFKYVNEDFGNEVKYSLGYASTCWVANIPGTEWVDSVNAFQTIDDVYEKYRLVSACIKVKYIGSLENVSGEIGGAIFTISTNAIGGNCYEDGELAAPSSQGYGLEKYFDIDYALDSIYSLRSTPLEGLRMLYFPLDNSFEEYQKVFGKDDFSHKGDVNTEYQIPRYEALKGAIKNGFYWFIWFDNVPEKGPFLFEMCCNFECLPKPSFLNFIPTSLDIYPISIDLKKQILKEVQNKALDKINN